jgi:hypothetical protein
LIGLFLFGSGGGVFIKRTQHCNYNYHYQDCTTRIKPLQPPEQHHLPTRYILQYSSHHAHPRRGEPKEKGEKINGGGSAKSAEALGKIGVEDAKSWMEQRLAKLRLGTPDSGNPVGEAAVLDFVRETIVGDPVVGEDAVRDPMGDPVGEAVVEDSVGEAFTGDPVEDAVVGDPVGGFVRSAGVGDPMGEASVGNPVVDPVGAEAVV